MPEVQLTHEASADFLRLPTAIKSRVKDVIVRLAEWPDVSGAKPMRRELKGAFRIRTGDYRVVFTVKGDAVVVFRIDNRRDVYER
jgi:mRNA-degrading endonuclease RelE of RelBE toxin-antitoxin system